MANCKPFPRGLRNTKITELLSMKKTTLKQFGRLAKQIMAGFIFMFIGLSAEAQSWNDAGNYSITWYTPASDVYISSPSELAGVAYLVNNNFTDFSGQTIHLTADIDLSGKNWIPIGYSYTFKGSIDGHGYKITGISIVNFSGIRGFIGKMDGGTIRCLTLTASIMNDSLSAYSTGILSAKATDCTFENINITGSIFQMTQNVSTSTEWNTTFYLGGISAVASNCSFTDITSDFHQALIFGKSGGSNCYGYFKLYAGSIVGYGSSKNSYLRCEGTSAFDNTVYGYVASNYVTHGGSTGLYCGGIVGYDATSTFTSCLSRITQNKGAHLTGTYDTVAFRTYGFGFVSSGIVKNCVAIVDSYSVTGHAYSWVASWYHTSASLYDYETFYPSRIGGCYINNDITKTTSKVGGDTQNFDGSTAYTKAQMNTQEFVDELNFYSRLNMDGEENFEIKNGQLAIKHAQYDDSGIGNIVTDTSVSEVARYDVSGRLLCEPVKGINIVKMSDGSIRKELVK